MSMKDMLPVALAGQSADPLVQSQLAKLLEMQTKIAELELRDRETADKKKKEQIELEARARQDNAKAAHQEQERQAWIQEHCSHRKQDGKSNLGGTWHWDRNMISLVCGNCGMIDTGTQSSLMMKYQDRYPEPKRIGGPQLGGVED